MSVELVGSVGWVPRMCECGIGGIGDMVVPLSLCFFEDWSLGARSILRCFSCRGIVKSMKFRLCNVG